MLLGCFVGVALFVFLWLVAMMVAILKKLDTSVATNRQKCMFVDYLVAKNLNLATGLATQSLA